MSGYLEVKYPFKSNLGLNPFKSWKRQWCILRPSPTFSGGILAVYCSEAGASAGTVELPSGFVVRRANSRTRPHAFAVFPSDEPLKPRVLLAASTLQDAHSWMDKIRSLLNGNRMMDTEGLHKDSYSVTVNNTELSRKCGLSNSDSTVTVSSAGVLVSRSQKLGVFVEWKYVTDATLSTESDRNATCVLTVNSEFNSGGGELHFCSPLAPELTAALKQGLSSRSIVVSKKLSKSEGDLRIGKCSDIDIGDVRRSSWYSGPSEVSLDDLDLVMSKDCKLIPQGQLSRRSGGRQHLAPILPLAPVSMDDSMSDRRSLVSIASGIYEEIPDVPSPQEDNVYCKMRREASFLKLESSLSLRLSELEPQYECVSECVYGTMRRARRRAPPPLPPRALHSGTKLNWCLRSSGVTRHSSLGSLPRPAPAPAPAPPPLPLPLPPATRTLPRWDRSRQAFSAFRKRLKSDSRTAVSPKSETSKDKDVATKKKKFDFTPTRDIFRSFKVSRKMKNLKITTNNLGNESKSCEFLDETEHVTANRCSKSVECLDGNDEYSDGFNADLSMEFNDTVAALSIPQEIVQLILNSRDKIRSSHDKILSSHDEILSSHHKILNSHEKMSISLKDVVEGDYLPMSPIVPPTSNIEHHYIVMSPRSNNA